jgi:acyl-CoA reductase-like NAD-dependent aldehyde dehydrogenase
VELSAGLVIDGEVRTGDLPPYPVTNPVDPDEVVLQAPAASSAQLDAAIAAAHRAQRRWATLSFDERAAQVAAAARHAGAVVEQLDLARLLTREHGKVLWESQFDTGTLGGMADAFVPLAARAISTELLGDSTTVQRVPHGVVGAIIPFNWPVAIFGNKVLPALLAGNAVIAKAPPTCPGALLATAAALAGELPPGLVNVVNGPGDDLGRELVAHPGVDMVTFTGGVAGGRSVMSLASQATKPVVLELGGNDPAILMSDLVVDDAFADRLAAAAFTTAGQVCMAVKRVYVPSTLLADVVDALAARLETEVVGDGLRPEVTMGPVHTAAGRDRAEGLLNQARSAGARVVRPASVHAADAGRGGWLVPPAIVVDPPADSDIVTTEQFAPVLPIISYRDVEDALAQANDSSFGLCASIWAADDEVAADLAGRLEAGTVFVNGHGMAAMDHVAPFGGWKASGFGQELGAEGMSAFTRVRVVRRAPGT